MGGTSFNHETSILVSKRMLWSHPSICLLDAIRDTTLSRDRNPRPSPRRYTRDEKTERPFIQRTQKGTIQASGIFQRLLIPSSEQRHLHAPRSTHHFKRASQNENPSPPLSSRSHATDRDRRGANVCRNRERGRNKYFHPSSFREEICLAI